MDSTQKPLNKVYHTKLGNPPFDKFPCCIYFYYFSKPISADGTRDVLHYCDTNGNKAINPGDMHQKLHDLTLNARHRGWTPPQCGSGTENIVWTRKSYVAVVVDDPEFVFDQHDAFVFSNEENHPNHSFFDGHDGVIHLEQGDKKSKAAFFWCINHMKADADGTDQGNDTQWYDVALHPDPMHQTRFPDSGGSNQGPPVPPPE